MEYTISDKKRILTHVLKTNGLTNEEANLFLSHKLLNSAEVYNGFYKDISYSKVISFFNPTNEFVNIFDIKGLEFKNSSFIDALLNIYRPESIYQNLGSFNFDKFHDSLKHSNFQLIEKDGKYYVFGDGNHRALLMLFQYYVEYIKLLKSNPSSKQIKEFNEKMHITAPVIHLDHDYNLLHFLREKYYDSNNYGNTEIDYLKHISNGKFNEKPVITYNKGKGYYNMTYKGLEFKKISPEEIIQFISELDNKKIKNNYYINKNSFVLSNSHFGVAKVPAPEVQSVDTYISKCNFRDLSFNYFISGDFSTKKFSLVFGGKDYGDKLNPDFNKINKFLEENKNLLNYKRVQDRYSSKEPIFTFYNYLNECKYENLDFNEAMTLINTIEKLNNLIIKPKQR